ncbi:MAG: hypothetical protein R3B55_02535 [Candidatus Paceibacterota bacterium]
MVEAQVAISPEQEKPIYAQPWIWGSKNFKDSPWGIGCFALAGEAWGEILIGPSYTFKGKKGFTEIGTQVGIETYNASPYRGMSYVFHKTPGKDDGLHDFSYLAVVEYGGSGHWHLGFLNYNITKSFGLGFVSQYGTVTGPRLQINIPSGFIWIGAGSDIENKASGGAVGLRFFM